MYYDYVYTSVACVQSPIQTYVIKESLILNNLKLNIFPVCLTLLHSEGQNSMEFWLFWV